MTMRLVPRLSISWAVFTASEAARLETTISEKVPKKTPNTARAVLILKFARERRAIVRFSRVRFMSAPDRLDGFEIGRLGGGLQAEENPHEPREEKADREGLPGEMDREGRDVLEQPRGGHSQNETDQSSHRRDDQGLAQELEEDVPPLRPYGAPDADLPRPLPDRKVKEVRQDKPRDDQRADTNDPDECAPRPRA